MRSIVPVGGGGLISGTATAVKALCPGARVIGVEPLAGDDVARSLASGRRVEVQVGRTIADGQQTSMPGELTWPVIQRRVDQVVTVSDEQIVAAMRVPVRALQARRRAQRRVCGRGAARGRGPARGVAGRGGRVGREHRRAGVRGARTLS